jgi:hypothetical protein
MFYQQYMDGITGLNLSRYFSTTGNAWFRHADGVTTVLWTVGDEYSVEKHFVEG